MTDTSKSPNHKWIHAQVFQFKALGPRYVKLAKVLKDILDQATNIYAPLAIVQTRPKAFSSFAEKIQRKKAKYPDPINQFTDLCGGRVITHTHDQVTSLSEFIKSHFDIDWENSVDVAERLKPTEFGYRSIHYIVSLKPGVFPTKDINVNNIPKEVFPDSTSPMKAEIQVRTILEHAWSDISHDLSYKGSFKIPDIWERELARMAAILETVDDAFSRFQEGLKRYAATYGAYMTEEQIRKEIAKLQTVLDILQGKSKTGKPENAQLASRIGKLAITLGDWQKTIDVLSKYTHTKCSPVLRDLGVAMCKKYSTKPKSSQYRRGQKYLERAIASDPYDVDAICSLAGTYKDIDKNKVLEYYHRAFQIDPSNPYPLVNYLQCEICAQKNIAIISMTKPVIEEAICRCYDQAQVGVNLPWAFYNIGKFQLLLGRPYESLAAYAKAISISSASFMVETSLQSVRKLKFLHDQLLGIDWVEKLLLIGLVTRFRKTADKKWTRKLINMALMNSRPFRPPVVIMIGGCDPGINKEMGRYRQLMINSFRNFHGTIISRGIASGISGIVGDVQQKYPDSVDTIGYLPRKLPKDAAFDKRYKKILQTGGSDFTLLQPLQNWIDIIASGIKPAEVKIIGINGGTIAAAEYRIALALGAKVAVIEKSGREAARLSDDENWVDAENLVSLIGDSVSINTFINYDRFGLPTKIRETIAKAIHEEYRKNQNKKLLHKELSMAGWNELIEILKQSNRSQADQIFRKLQEFNYSVREVRDRKISLRRFTKKEIEIMAEIEHSRWNVERSLDSWKWSPEKDVEKKLTPYLVSWAQLPEDIKELDRQAVRAIPKLLAKVGLEIYRQKKGRK